MKRFWQQIHAMPISSNYRLLTTRWLRQLAAATGLACLLALGGWRMADGSWQLAMGHRLPATSYQLQEPSGRASDQVDRWPPQRFRLDRNTVVSGQLITNTGRLQDKTFFDLYEFHGRAGQFITLTLTSPVFDTYLVLVAPNNTVAAFNDDANAKAGSDSQLRLALPLSGVYQVWVNSFAGDLGEYTLAFESVHRIEADTALFIGERGQGWLMPGDTLNEQGFYADQWTIALPDEPLLVQVISHEFDTKLTAFTPDGKLLIQNDDINFVAGDGNSRVVLAPSTEAGPEGEPPLEPGTVITLEVSLPGEHAIGGVYEIEALPMPASFESTAVVQVRPVVVHIPGADNAMLTITDAQIQAGLMRAQELWQACGILVKMAAGETVQVIEVDGLASPIEVEENPGEWTADETRLHTHPTHAAYEERLITLYIVPDLNGGERDGVAYPSTRYAAGRSGVIMVTAHAIVGHDAGRGPSGWRHLRSNVLAHEIGHILGLEHPNPVTGDGDPWNDGADNLMSANAASGAPLAHLTPLQCLVARGETHYLHPVDDEPLIPPAFLRNDRVLLPGDRIEGALTTHNMTTGTPLAPGPLLEVYYFPGVAGQEIRITLESQVFDPVLLLDGPDGERIAVDDDGGDGWNAEIAITLPESGDYSIGVTSFERAVGRYQLTVSSK